MSRKNNHHGLQDITDLANIRNLPINHGISDLLSLTDSETSSTSSNNQVFEHNDPLVLELHELKRDELPDNPLPEVKTRKLLKKKKKGQAPVTQSGSLSSSSPSENSIAPSGPEEIPREEFYDAHESYHALPENQATSAVTTAAIAQVHSEHAGQPKVTQPLGEQSAPPQSATRQPSTTVKKPTTQSQPK